VNISNTSDAKFADKNSGIRYFFKSIFLKTENTQMVKQRKTRTRKKPYGKGFALNSPKAGIINASTVFF
jgi:hypothetical protein